MGLIDYFKIAIGVEPKVVRASLMFNKQSGLYWSAEGTRQQDNSYAIEVVAPVIDSERKTFKGRDQYGGTVGPYILEKKFFWLYSVDWHNAENLKDCVEKLAEMQKQKQDQGYRPKIHLVSPRYPLPNLKTTARFHNIQIPQLD